VPTTPGPAALDALCASFAAGAVQVITATSVEIGANLLKIAALALRREFERTLWLVPGERVAAALRELGLSAPLLQADSAEDQDLVAALLRWRARESGA
jgi:uroporphyrinogen-III synthase